MFRLACDVSWQRSRSILNLIVVRGSIIIELFIEVRRLSVENVVTEDVSEVDGSIANLIIGLAWYVLENGIVLLEVWSSQSPCQVIGIFQVFNNQQTALFAGIVGIEVLDVGEQVSEGHLNWITGVLVSAGQSSLKLDLKRFS